MPGNKPKIKSPPATHVYTDEAGVVSEVRVAGELPDGRVSIVSVGPLKPGEPVGLVRREMVSPIVPQAPLKLPPVEEMKRLLRRPPPLVAPPSSGRVIPG